MEAMPKVMVVDDEIGICQNVQKILEKNHFEVTCAVSAREALDRMAEETYSLLISDIVMPEMNGLQLLKTVKKEWPETKTVMMTAYASIDTAVKAIRLGALDYLPKPFTPDELRQKVKLVFDGSLKEAPTSAEERSAIDAIDVDIPFDAKEVAEITGEGYVESLGPSDMPVVEVRSTEPLEGFCEVGNMVCDIFKKLGATCKAGTKSSVCPQLKKKKAKKAAATGPDVRTLIGIDQPFNYDEVAAVTGPEYIRSLQHDGVVIPTYEQLKENVARLDADLHRQIDVDMPFDAAEVDAATGGRFAKSLGTSDRPVVEVTVPENLEGFCEVGTMVCDIFTKLGATCKAGTKSGVCPQLKKKKKAKVAVNAVAFDPRRHISVDMPFDVQEVAAVTGEQYVAHLAYDGLVQVPYEQVKANVARMDAATGIPVAAPTSAPEGLPLNPILVIDDEAAVNNNIRKILMKNGFQVDQAMTKAEAMARLSDRTYELILLDLKIPGVKGLEMLEAVRDRQPQAKVVMITGYASIETAVEATRMGAVAYLPKPFTPDEIRTATEDALKLAA